MKLLAVPVLLLLGYFALAQDESEPRLEWRNIVVDRATTLRYAVHTPPNFDPAETHPCLIAFPPGDQGEGLGTWVVDYFADAADQGDWILVVPVAEPGQGWWKDLATHVTALTSKLESDYAIEYGRFHVAGISNGGRSAFRVVGDHPEIAHSLTVLPGMPTSDDDWLHLQNLAHLPIAMYVGGTDEAWVDAARRAESQLGELGAPDVQLSILEGQAHVLGKEVVSSVFDGLEKARRRTESEETAREAVNIVLDKLHEAAATANSEEYFKHFAPAATFIGTDATERWSLSEFREFAKPHFESGKGWAYQPLERHIEFSPNLRVAWFDERLMNEKLGETRGSGVLLETGGRWRLSHYVLSFSIPNGVAAGVTELVRGTEGEKEE